MRGKFFLRVLAFLLVAVLLFSWTGFSAARTPERRGKERRQQASRPAATQPAQTPQPVETQPAETPRAAPIPEPAEAAQPPQATQPSGAVQPSTAPTAYEVKKVSEDWVMEDGVTLPVSVFFPAGAAAGRTFPLIVVVHGWTLDRAMTEWAAEYYASRGYVALAFTARGWFGAGGEVGCMDPEREMRDVSRIITLASKDERFPVLEDEKGAVAGITGASMGGCFSYLKAPRRNPRPGDPGDERIRAVVPMHGSFDLLYSLYPNDVLKFFWVTGLLGTSYAGNLTGLMVNLLNIAMDAKMGLGEKLQAAMGVMSKLSPPFNAVSGELPEILTIAMQRRVEDEEYARQWLRVRSARYWCDREYDGVVEHPITAPMLILAGWNDDLFHANEGLMAYSYTDAPRRIIITNHGHLGCYPGPLPGGAPLGSPESAWVMGEVDRWFDRFLKGVENGVEAEPPVAFYRAGAPAEYGKASAYPLPGTTQLSLYLGDRLSGGRAGLKAQPPAGASAPDLLLNIGITGSLSLPYFQDAPELMGGPTMEFPLRLKFMEIPYTERSYVSEPLVEDLTIMGPPLFQPYYQASDLYTQLIPWLYEVTPDGREILVSRGFYEGHNYEGLADPSKRWKLMNPTAPLEMQACYHRFSKGSRIKLEVSTADLLTCWPCWGLNIILLHKGGKAASRVVLPVVPD